jgi:hypothetical protein
VHLVVQAHRLERRERAALLSRGGTPRIRSTNATFSMIVLRLSSLKS